MCCGKWSLAGSREPTVPLRPLPFLIVKRLIVSPCRAIYVNKKWLQATFYFGFMDLFVMFSYVFVMFSYVFVVFSYVFVVFSYVFVVFVVFSYVFVVFVVFSYVFVVFSYVFV